MKSLLIGRQSLESDLLVDLLVEISTAHLAVNFRPFIAELNWTCGDGETQLTGTPGDRSTERAKTDSAAKPMQPNTPRTHRSAGQPNVWAQAITESSMAPRNLLRNPSSSQLMCLVWNLVTCWIHLVGFVCTQSSKASNKAFLWTQSNEQTPSVRPSALPSKAAKKAEAAGPTTTPSWEALALFRYKIMSLDWGLHVNTLHVLGIQINRIEISGTLVLTYLNIVCLGFLSQHSKLDKQQPGSPKTGMIENHRTPMIAGSPYYRGANCAACELTL